MQFQSGCLCTSGWQIQAAVDPPVNSHQSATAFAMMKNVIGYIDNTGFLVLILLSLLVQ